MPRNTKKKTASLPGLIDALYEQTDLIRDKKADIKDVKALNQTSNQIMNAYKLQLAAYKAVGSKGNANPIKGLLQ